MLVSMCRLVLLVAFITPGRAANNGEALLPPMGWRSWNSFYADIDDKKIRAQIDALVKPRDAAGTTLFSLGYKEIGIDEGWEGCHPVHYPNGTPAVDTSRFPDLAYVPCFQTLAATCTANVASFASPWAGASSPTVTQKVCGWGITSTGAGATKRSRSASTTRATCAK